MLARATLAAFCLALAACSSDVAEIEAEQETQSGPRKVQTLVVEHELLAEPVKAFGTIAAKQSSFREGRRQSIARPTALSHPSG